MFGINYQDQKIYQTRDVVFTHNTSQIKTAQSKPNLIKSSDKEPYTLETFTVERTHKEAPVDNTLSVSPQMQLPRDLARADVRAQQRRSAQPQPPSPQPIDSDTESEDDPLLLQSIDDGGADPATYIASSPSMTLPQSYHQVLNSSNRTHWESAMRDELDKMDKYKVWEVVSASPEQQVVGAKWVYSRKIDGDTGKPSKYKARWVAKGYSQVKGLDYTELFSSVAHKDSIRLFLALVNHLDLECDQVDIMAAFLNGDLEETIYLSPPEGSGIPSNKVLLLRKSLYELKQSPRCFNKALDKWLRSQGFFPTQADPCVYIKRDKENILMLCVHVDNQLIACNSRQMLDSFKATLNSAFECSDSGPAKYFLGFNILSGRWMWESGKAKMKRVPNRRWTSWG